jgi:hypothetical protein
MTKNEIIKHQSLRVKSRAVIYSGSIILRLFINLKPNFFPVLNTGHVRNPQTEAFLELLELPYLLDHALESTPGQPPVALPGTG